MWPLRRRPRRASGRRARRSPLRRARDRAVAPLPGDELLTGIVRAARDARRLRRRTRVAGTGLLSIIVGVPALLQFGLRPSYPTDFVAGMARLPPALRVVATSLDEAEAVAAPLRAAGVPVETWSTGSFRAVGDQDAPAAWWVSRKAAAVVRDRDVERVLDLGGRVLLDGDTPLSRELLQLRPARGAPPTVRSASMRGVTLHWDLAVATLQPHVPGNAVATTEVGTPALFVAREGLLWWSAPSLSEGTGPRRLPFLAQELADHWGLRPRASRVGVDAFVDLDAEHGTPVRELVQRWQAAGITRVFVPAWKQNDDLPWRYDYRPLIRAAHGRGIEVWAWVEWPHVDFSFWRRNPDCRERTASGNVAKVNWRELVAVEVPDCFDRAWKRTRAVLNAAPYDGVNVAGLAFESPYFGYRAPEYYTPFHPTIRRDFLRRYGWDPIEIVRGGRHDARRDAASLAQWDRYRKDLLLGVYERLLTRLAALPAGAHLAVTLLDEEADPVQGPLLRDNSGAANREIVALADEHGAEVLLRDEVPFRVIDAERIRDAYDGLAARTPGLGVSAVRRPERGTAITDQPVGLELAIAVHDAAVAGAPVALHSSSALRADDLAWTPFAYAAASVRVNENQGVVTTDSAHPFRLHLAGRARRIRIDGHAVGHGDAVDVPAGHHWITAE